MRTWTAVLAAAAVVSFATPAHASSLSFDPVDTASISAGSFTVTGSATFDGPPGAVQAFADGQLDDQLLLEATPPVQDLVAGFVGIDRSGQTLDLTWEVVDIPDSGGVPELFRYMWDFSLTPPGGEAVLFQVQAKATNFVDSNGPQLIVPAGEVNGRCDTSGTVITCTRIGEAPVEIDPATNRITMRIPFSVLKDGDGNVAMVEGALFATTDIFQGIVAILQTGLSLGQAGDVAQAPEPFVVGDHVQLSLVQAGIPDEHVFYSAFALPDTAGSFSQSFETGFLSPGEWEVVGRPCTDGACGISVREAVTVTS